MQNNPARVKLKATKGNKTKKNSFHIRRIKNCLQMAHLLKEKIIHEEEELGQPVVLLLLDYVIDRP
ncbi:hypothetical protein RchiOBHm_Chr4g0410811 [Rosa chinensis]|uniref:Uncharacterized protein n=1 Tax=Rosa chinensis TaxID=74649 RepID=A0A2P6QVG7_ROSCH|nr:hypothetical protein RchiOBHm_Chr4g0410811 [Rosa chinensis]